MKKGPAGPFFRLISYRLRDHLRLRIRHPVLVKRQRRRGDTLDTLPAELQPELEAIALHGSEEQFSALDNLTADEFIVTSDFRLISYRLRDHLRLRIRHPVLVKRQRRREAIALHGSEEQFSALDNLTADEFIASIERITPAAGRDRYVRLSSHFLPAAGPPPAADSPSSTGKAPAVKSISSVA
jgi:hypothetical protein